MTMSWHTFCKFSLLGWKTAVNDVIGNSDECVPCYSHVTLKLHFESLGNHCKISRFVLVMIGRNIFNALLLLCTHIFNIIPPLISTQSWQRWSISWRSCLTMARPHAQISSNSCQIRLKDPQEHKLQAPCYSNLPERKWSPGMRWDIFQQPRHYTVWQWCFYPIVKTCKKWVMTLSSSMAMYSVMRDIPDARLCTNGKSDELLFTDIATV